MSKTTHKEEVKQLLHQLSLIHEKLCLDKKGECDLPDLLENYGQNLKLIMEKL